MADKVAEQAYPQTESRFTFMMEHHPAAYSVDRTAGANPIRQQLHNLNDAGSLYGSIIYHKAPIVMNQLELTVGRQRFQQALQQYLKTYAGSNANWPQLIAVLEKMGIANITQWNNNWINKSGRPLITYTLQQKGHNIQQLTVQQQDPQRGGRLWNQRFNIAFVYADSVHLLPVQLTGNKVVVTAAAGMPVPLQMVFNATGEGYGLFPVDTNMLNSTNPISSNVMRAAAYLNLYENVLDGHATTPAGLLQFYGKALLHEENDLLLSSISRQYKNIFWQFITPTARIKAGLQAEQDLAAAIDQAASPAKIRTLFKLYAAVALSPAAMQQLYSWWQQKQGPKNLSLNDDELTDLAAELALRNHPQAAALLDTQLARISNPDRKDRLRYLLPALSANVAVRNAFFATLSTNRTNQNYIATVLSYLHHPLRMPAGELYLQQSLQLLADVKAKGGVFFPTDWLANTFGLYQSTTAAQIVTGFLKAHPGYDPTLRLKILQETDDLFRSLRINGSK
jgi:aminopeptidase N